MDALALALGAASETGGSSVDSEGLPSSTPASRKSTLFERNAQLFSLHQPKLLHHYEDVLSSPGVLQKKARELQLRAMAVEAASQEAAAKEAATKAVSPQPPKRATTKSPPAKDRPYSASRRFFGNAKATGARSSMNPAIYMSQESSKGEVQRPVSAVTRRLPKPRPLSGQFSIRRLQVATARQPGEGGAQHHRKISENDEQAIKNFIMNNLLDLQSI